MIQAFAQEEENVLATQRNWTAELYIPTAEEGITINQIRFRYFLGQKTAFRVSTMYSSTSNEPSANVKVTRTNFELGFGLEKHFGSFKNVSPFLGFDYVAASNNRKVDEGFQSIFGALDLSGTERGYIKSGGKVVLGVDYYPVKGFYLGTEFGLLVSSQRAREIKQGANKESAVVVVEEGTPQRQLEVGSAGVIRVGFVF